jgi:16S rRNA (adenine1518-N6/adenine1519-N6)-dimethyltransferase
LATKARSVTSFEIDPVLASAARAFASAHKNVTIVTGDFLKQDLKAFARKPFKVVSNLPYNITSPVLEKLYESGGTSPTRAVMTIQKEVAERLAAWPGTKEYGSITVILRALTDIRIVGNIGPTSFTPQPNVISSVIAITRLDKSLVPAKEWPLFRAIVRSGFNQRRKKLSNALRSVAALTSEPQALLDASQATGISLDRRAETLSVDEFAALTHAAYR